MNVLIIDNYDSFTYNLYQLIGELLEQTHRMFRLRVFRNDKITVKQIKRSNYDRIILSPGPGDPSDPSYFGVCKDILIDVGRKTPVLGVCLGMQGIAYYYGGRIIKSRLPMHGKTSSINHDKNGVFLGLPQGLEVMRYHSLVADPVAVPESLIVTATVGSEVMGLRHKAYPIEGIQFHPESFATEAGRLMIENFLFNNHSLSEPPAGGKSKTIE